MTASAKRWMLMHEAGNWGEPERKQTLICCYESFMKNQRVEPTSSWVMFSSRGEKPSFKSFNPREICDAWSCWWADERAFRHPSLNSETGNFGRWGAEWCFQQRGWRLYTPLHGSSTTESLRLTVMTTEAFVFVTAYTKHTALSSHNLPAWIRDPWIMNLASGFQSECRFTTKHEGTKLQIWETIIIRTTIKYTIRSWKAVKK